MTNMAVALPPQVTQAIAPKYYEKQSLGFCNFLASIGIAPSAEQCAPLQRQYLEARNAIGKWYTGLSMYYRVLSGGVTPIVR
jgi:hypothetical protein